MKTDLTKTTAIIHFRKDSDDRLFNLKTVLRFFDSFVDIGELIVINDDADLDPSMKEMKGLFPSFTYKFFKNDGVYRRCLCFNEMARTAKTPVVMFYDTDVLVKPEFLKISEGFIMTGKVDHVYPYNGIFANVKKAAFENFLPDYNFKLLEESLKERELGYSNDFLEIAHTNSVGGLLMLTKEAFFRIGGYDENFIGWGGEDVDICRRSGTINRVSKISDTDAICWHLHHDNTIRTENPFYKDNLKRVYAGKN